MQKKQKLTPVHSTVTNIYELIQEAETLKTLLRHSWLSNGRQESVAEHTWRMAFMAILIGPHLGGNLNLEKVLSMIVVHDLAEIKAGDYHAFKQVPTNKHQLEQRALKELLRRIPKPSRDKIISLWKEFESAKTAEAKFAQALDKLEVLIQHNQADISTWESAEYDFNYFYANSQVAYSPLLTLIREFVLQDTHNKIMAEVKTI